jgi:glycine cleavage system H protein
MYPTDLRYTRDHEWVRKESDGTMTVGITEFAAKQLGEVVFVELPEVGRTLDAEEPLGTVESVKAVSEVYMPFGGEITAANAELNDSPELVNDDPHGDGWFIKVRPANAKDRDALMTAAAYEEYLKTDD